MPDVLITGARAPVALDCARAFRAAGYRVHLADSVTPWAARLSRDGWNVHSLPPPRYRFSEFSSRLRSLVNRIRPSLVIPTCEEVFYVASALHGCGTKVFAPNPSLLRTLHSKFDFARLLNDIGINGPKTILIDNPAQLSALDSQDLVFKPEFSRFGTATVIRPKRVQLESLAPSPTRRWVAQKFIKGEEISSWSAAVEGRITAHVTYRPAWRLGHSASFAFEAIDQPEVESIAAKIASSTAMTGHLAMDIIVSNDRVLPIECNPRAVSGLHLFDARAELAGAILGQTEIGPPAARLRYLAPAMLILGIPQAIHHRTLKALARDWRRGADVVGRSKDWAASSGVLIDAARFALLGLSRRRSTTAQTTDDIEWNGEDFV